MQRVLYILSVLTLVLAWLLPYHRSPWPTFGSEVLTFISASFLIIGISQSKVKIPRPQIFILPFLLIPIVQLMFGQNIYLSNALFSFSYILFFILMVLAGYNLSSDQPKREKIFGLCSLTFAGVAFISSVFAILQWLDMHTFFAGIIYSFNGNRPYANLAQPNNLATLLIMGIFACLYLFEKRIIANLYLVPISFIILFGIVLAQSRTSMLVCGFFIVYWLIKQYKIAHRFKLIHLVCWVALFGFIAVNLSLINQWLFAITDSETAVKSSAIAAKGTGDIRIEMWKQMITAIMQNPWFGYGWNQTGLAQYIVTDSYQVSLWYKSAHNIVLDLLIWNGVILGGLILIYLLAWLYWLNKGARDQVSIIASLMLGAILIHGLLEFPLHYAYFLLPAGFLLGVIQSQYPNLPCKHVNGKWLLAIGLITIIGASITTRDYFLYKEQSVIVSSDEEPDAEQRKTLDRKIWLITQFKYRIWWIGLDPNTHLTAQQLERLHLTVGQMASKFDLFKYAQVLAYNGYRKEAEHQLWILETLHGQKKTYDDLLKD